MNLRKDHSHAFNQIIVNALREVLLGDGDSIDAPDAEARGRFRLEECSAHPCGPCRLVRFPSHVVSLTVSALDHVSAFLSLQLSAMDVSARTPMKGAAKCDKHCELQNSVNQWKPERTLRFRDTPESLPASVSIRLCASSASCLAWCRCCVCLRAREPSRPWRAQRLGCPPCCAIYQAPSVLEFALPWGVLVNEAHAALFPRHEVRSANPLNLSI